MSVGSKREGRGLTHRPATITRAQMARAIKSDPVVAEDTSARPRTRGDCVNGPRPCPWVACRHHLALEVNERGNVRLVFPDRDLEQMTETCSLDVADAGQLTLHEVGDLLNITRERARQLEAGAMEWFKLAGGDAVAKSSR